MQVVLVMFRAEGERRSFSVTKDVTIVGRREDCDLRIPVSEVSRKHCRFLKEGDELRVEDLGSSNGTYHNGQRIQGGVLVEPGDSVQVGPVVFVVQVDGEPPDDELVPFTDRAAHHLVDTAVGGPPEMANIDASTAQENLEHLQVSEEVPLEEAEEIPMIETADEDDLVLDMNLEEEETHENK